MYHLYNYMVRLALSLNTEINFIIAKLYNLGVVWCGVAIFNEQLIQNRLRVYKSLLTNRLHGLENGLHNMH